MSHATDQARPRDADIEAASDWLLRLTSGSATDSDLEDFKTWRDGDSRHRVAFAEVRELWNDLEALAPAFEPATAPQPVSRVAELPGRAPRAASGRRRLAFGALAAGLAALAVFAGDLPTRLAADHRTAEGERSTVELPDGSVAHLNTDSAIALAYSEGAREVTLLRGEALFDVARNPARPFRVAALDGQASALGTVFAVRSRGESALVTVVEGRVRVAAPQGAPLPAESVDLSRNQQVAYAAKGPPGPVREVDADKLTAWRRGVLYIEGLPLAEALREIDRHHPGRIFLLADGDTDEPVSARIALDRLDSGIKALAATQGLSVTHLTDFIVVVR